MLLCSLSLEAPSGSLFLPGAKAIPCVCPWDGQQPYGHYPIQLPSLVSAAPSLAAFTPPSHLTGCVLVSVSRLQTTVLMCSITSAQKETKILGASVSFIVAIHTGSLFFGPPLRLTSLASCRMDGCSISLLVYLLFFFFG